jgi:ribokinase/sulfofructose kinase
MSAPSLDLVAVGNAVIDHVHRVPFLPQRDSAVVVLDRRSSPGGVEANVAAAAAGLGLRVGLIARVGSDPEGRMVLDDIRQRGVDVARMQIGGEGETAYTHVFVDPDGDRVMMTGGEGVRRLDLDAEDDATIRRARACFTSGYLPWRHLERVARLCSGEGAPLFVFDLPGEFADLEARGLRREHVDAIIPSIDIFLTNRGSLSSYTGARTIEDGLAELREKGVRRASVSDGRRGVSLVDARAGEPEIVHVPAFPIAAVDTTGAGDALHAALIAEWGLAGRPAAEAGRFAAAAAALACRDFGCRSALPTRAEVAALAQPEAYTGRSGPT